MNILNKKKVAVKFKTGKIQDKGRQENFLAAEADKNANLHITENITYYGINSHCQMLFILNPSSISSKILTYPFKLKGVSQTKSLSVIAIEEFTPFKPDELTFIATKISDNSILLEYIKKDDLKEISDGLELMGGGKNRVKFYFPYSLLLKIATSLKIAENGEKMAFIHNFENESYGILFDNRVLKDIVGLNLLSSENTKTAPLSIATLNALREYKVLYLNNFKNNLKNIGNIGNDAYIQGYYLDLYFLLTLKQNELPPYATAYKSDSGIFGHFGNALPILKYSSSFLIIILLTFFVWTTENYYNKLDEKNALNAKINKILRHYMPGKAVFYEPKFEIKSYYNSLKEKAGGKTKSKDILNFIRYISAYRQSIKDLKIDKIGYSLGEFSLKGSVSGYSLLNKFKSYLKNGYYRIKRVRSYKNSEGLVKFGIYLIKK